MMTIDRGAYILMMSHDPCEIFTHLEKEEVQGMRYSDCRDCSDDDPTYLLGMVAMHEEKGKPFVFLNLSKCENPVLGTCLIFYEMTKLAFLLFGMTKYDPERIDAVLNQAEACTLDAIELIQRLQLDKIRHN
jgi:hypothetical protein